MLQVGSRRGEPQFLGLRWPVQLVVAGALARALMLLCFTMYTALALTQVVLPPRFRRLGQRQTHAGGMQRSCEVLTLQNRAQGLLLGAYCV